MLKRVTFSKNQIEALKRMLKSCHDCAVIGGNFNEYGFVGAIEAAFNSLVEDKYLYIEEVSEDETKRSAQKSASF